MNLHNFPVDVENPVCTTCGGPLDPEAECPLTEKSAPWAKRFGVRCPECEEQKRARQATINRLDRARAKEAAYFAGVGPSRPPDDTDAPGAAEPHDNLGRALCPETSGTCER